eukprot:2517077-Pyramimonas_sp.AAC.1
MRGERTYKAALAAIREMHIRHREHLSANKRTYMAVESDAPSRATPPCPTPPASWPVDVGDD